MHVEGRIVRQGERYRLTLSLRDGAVVRSRSIVSDSCADLAGAAAVALGLLLRNERDGTQASGETAAGGGREGASKAGAKGAGAAAAGTDGTPASSAGASPDQTGKPSSSGVQKSPEQAAQKSSEQGAQKSPDVAKASAKHETKSQDEPAGPPRHWHVLLRAPDVALDIGRMPKPSVGVGAGLGVRYDAWQVFALGRVFGAQTLRAPNTPNVSARLERVTLGFEVCHGFRSGLLEFSPCVDAGLERLKSRGQGADVASTTDSSIALVLGASGNARLHLFEFLALVGWVGLGFDSSHPAIMVTGLEPVHELGWVQVSFGLGPEWIF